MRNKNVWILAGLVAFIAIVAALGALFMHAGAPFANAPELSQAAGIEIIPPANAPETGEAAAYLRITVGGTAYQPIPLNAEGDYTIRQTQTGAENVVHVTPESMIMQSSTCKNQDCVKQGVVTLTNMDGRLLGNMIICLPNQVTLELYTPDQDNGQFVVPGKEP